MAFLKFPRIRFHLLTGVILMIAAAVILWANMRASFDQIQPVCGPEEPVSLQNARDVDMERSREGLGHLEYSRIRCFGWPLPFCYMQNRVHADQNGWMDSEGSDSDESNWLQSSTGRWRLACNAVAWMIVLLAVFLMSEWVQRIRAGEASRVGKATFAVLLLLGCGFTWANFFHNRLQSGDLCPYVEGAYEAGWPFTYALYAPLSSKKDFYLIVYGPHAAWLCLDFLTAVFTMALAGVICEAVMRRNFPRKDRVNVGASEQK